VTERPDPTDRQEPVWLLKTVGWWLRLAVFAVVAAIVLTTAGAGAAGLIELAIGAAAFAGWWASEHLPAPWADRLLTACLIALAAIGGFAVSSRHETTIVALAIIAILAAGSELSSAGLLAVLAAGVLGIEIGAIGHGVGDVGTLLGYPAVLAAAALAGRYRRAYRIQAEQARALLAESRRAQHDAERLAALTERSRIAREIHDVLAHSLGALGIQLQAAEAMLSERQDIDSALISIAHAQRLVGEGLTEIRRAVHALRADSPPLPEALATLVADDPDRLTVDGEPYALSPAAGLALLRVAQEAIVNARKHADGQAATITLTYTDTAVELRVENELRSSAGDGAALGVGGYGLAGMHERLRLIGGELTAGAVGDRWVVRAMVVR
jgi:signal transduction histidine kinase